MLFGTPAQHHGYCSLFSYLLTGAAGFQTLGEEYSDVLQVDKSGPRLAVPSSLVSACFSHGKDFAVVHIELNSCISLLQLCSCVMCYMAPLPA